MNADSIPARAILGGLKLYKVLVSPLFAGSCRYLPSCSDYMAEAVHRHGPASGVWLGLKRLSRCHPWGGSGLDPVPQRQGPGTGDRPFDRLRAAPSSVEGRGPVADGDTPTPPPAAGVDELVSRWRHSRESGNLRLDSGLRGATPE